RAPAQVLVAADTGVAEAARDDRIDRDSRADRDPCVRSDRVDDARRLVTEHDRIPDTRVTAGVDREVGVTDRGGGDADERFTSSGRRHRPIRDLELARLDQDSGARQWIRLGAPSGARTRRQWPPDPPRSPGAGEPVARLDGASACKFTSRP